VKQMQRFLGMVNFYRRFTPGIAKTLEPLTAALKGGKKTLQWSPQLEEAFNKTKQVLVKAVPLAHPAPDAEVSLHTDASDQHIGGALQQKVRGSWQPLGFFSRKLNVAETKYSTFDRELLAASQGIRHFRHILEGRDFQLWTDHKPLVTALTRISDPWSARQQRHLASISEFTTDLRYIPGPENVVADALSRPPTPPLGPAGQADTAAAVAAATMETDPIDFQEMATEQTDCAETQRLISGSTALTISFQTVNGHRLAGDTSTGQWRTIVPLRYRRAVFNHIHNLAHPGTLATKRLLCSRFVWPAINKDAAAWTRDCAKCQQSKVHRHVHVKPLPIPIPQRRFAHIHIDLVGPLPMSLGCNHILTIIDRTTKWMEAIPLTNTAATDVAAALCSGWIARFGVPDTITSDRGPQFTSNIWNSLCLFLQIKHRPTTAYHPQANGMVERLHRRLKDALRARGANATWAAELHWVLLGLRTQPREDTNISPAQAVYGTPLVLPNQYLSVDDDVTNKFLVQINKTLTNPSLPRHNIAANRELPEDLPPDLWAADRVWVRRCGHVPPLTPLYDGPYAVNKRSLRYFQLQIGGKEDSISTSRLKPCSSSTPTAAPPTRGRPRLHPIADPPPPPTLRRRRRVRFNLPPAAADSGTVFPVQPDRFFERPEEATNSRYPRRQRGPPPHLRDYNF